MEEISHKRPRSADSDDLAGGHDSPNKRQNVSEEIQDTNTTKNASSNMDQLSIARKISLTELTGIKEWYSNSEVAPIIILNNDETLIALKKMQEDSKSILADINAFGDSIASKADSVMRLAYVSQHDNEAIEDYEDEDEEKTIDRCFSYDLNGTPVGRVKVLQNTFDINKIYITILISHPCVRRAASALLEKIMQYSAGEPDITLSSTHEAMIVYRKLGFIPENQDKFDEENIKMYDDFFLSKTKEETKLFTEEQLEAYNSYRQMRLQPKLSNLWELKDKVWHYIPDGVKYLTCSPA